MQPRAYPAFAAVNQVVHLPGEFLVFLHPGVLLAPKDVGKFLAIDIETGEYEIAADELRAGNKLRARLPEAQIWMVRIGYASARSFGGRSSSA